MPNYRETFNNKFSLLCSQESHDEINWSSTDSSDYENVLNTAKHASFHQKNRKRKRKRKGPKNISNLDITIVDITNDKDVSQIKKREETSPILSSHYLQSHKFNFTNKSPVVHPTTKSSEREQMSKSPIIVLKTASPINSQSVKKKLFKNINKVDKINIKSKSAPFDYDVNSENYSVCLRRKSINKMELNNKECAGEDIEFNVDENKPPNTNEDMDFRALDDSLDSLKSSKVWNLANKVKLYFDSHFSSESASQVSIQDSLTPKNSSKTSDDIEIIDLKSQIKTNSNNNEPLKEESESVPHSKRIRYKKNGLAYRLNLMLKKHNASISLWQHERFLAENSNFVIPKGEHLVFIIRNVEIKYGCFLLQARNIESEQFLILINNKYVNNCNIHKDMVLKIYEPYKILELNNQMKLVVSVCKFQGETLNDS